MKLIIAVLVGVILYFAQMILYKRYWDRGLNIGIDFSKSFVHEGDENQLVETIRNDKRLPLPVLQVKFAITRSFRFKNQGNSAVTDQYYRNDFFSLLPFQMITRKYDFVCQKRGYYRMNGMDVVCKDLFLKGKMIRSLDHEAAVCVLPRHIPVEERPLKARELIGQIADLTRRNEDPFEFAGIREYQPYDPMNRINWKASAKSPGLMVNVFNTTYTHRVIIFVNMECHIKWHEDVFIEEEIRIAASLADSLIQKHIPVALYSNGCDLLTGEQVCVRAGSDPLHLKNIEIALARLVKPADESSLFSEMILSKKEELRLLNTECILISNYRKKDLIDAYRELKDEGINVSWVIPEYGMVTPSLIKEGDKDIFKWTVKYDR